MNRKRKRNDATHYELGPKGGILMIRNGRAKNVDKRKVPDEILDILAERDDDIYDGDINLGPMGILEETKFSIEDPWGANHDLALGSRCGWMVQENGEWTHLPSSLYHRWRMAENGDAKEQQVVCKEGIKRRRRERKNTRRRERRRQAQNRSRSINQARRRSRTRSRARRRRR